MASSLLFGLFLAVAAAQDAVVPTVTVRAWGANSYRLSWASPGGYTCADPVLLTPFLPAPLSSTPSWSASDGSTYTNGNLQVAVDAATGLVTATRLSDGAVVLRQRSIAWGAAIAAGDPPSAELVLDGPSADETLVGMGERGLDDTVVLPLPFHREVWEAEYYAFNEGRSAFLPLWFSSLGVGTMLTMSSYGSVKLDRGGATTLNSSSVRCLEVWVTVTPDTPVYAEGVPHPFLALLRQYADAVGYAPRMPAFAAGFIASKDRYHNQSQFLAVARGYADRGLPLSMLVVDWFHWVALGDMKFNAACWPDPAGMIAELRGMGIETMVTHWPFMSATSAHRAAFESAGALAINASSGQADVFWQYLQEGALILPFTPEQRNATWAAWMEGYGSLGVRAVWLDETEPDRTGPANDLVISGGWRYGNWSSLEVGQAWKAEWIGLMGDGLRGLYGEGNYFLLSRSAWLGTARRGHAMWSGDTDSTWDIFAKQVPAALGAGLSGIGLWTSDIGGYYSAAIQPFNTSLEELLVRWAQFASVSPLMRLHGHRAGGPPSDPICMQTNGDNEPWTLFRDVPGARYDAFVAAMRWREAHRNYVVDTQAAAAASNAPMVAPLWLLFPGEMTCAPTPAGGDGLCAGAFMFGSDWLAKPITKEHQESEWVWLPRLPAGQRWVYEFNQTSMGQGGVNVTVLTPISEFPLFQRVYTQGP